MPLEAEIYRIGSHQWTNGHLCPQLVCPGDHSATVGTRSDLAGAQERPIFSSEWNDPGRKDTPGICCPTDHSKVSVIKTLWFTLLQQANSLTQLTAARFTGQIQLIFSEQDTSLPYLCLFYRPDWAWLFLKQHALPGSLDYGLAITGQLF